MRHTLLPKKKQGCRAACIANAIGRSGHCLLHPGQTCMSADALSSLDPAAPHDPDVDRTVIAAAKEFAPGMSTGAHSHDRAQLVFAIRGLMVATTEIGTWAVPPGGCPPVSCMTWRSMERRRHVPPTCARRTKSAAHR